MGMGTKEYETNFHFRPPNIEKVAQYGTAIYKKKISFDPHLFFKPLLIYYSRKISAQQHPLLKYIKTKMANLRKNNLLFRAPKVTADANGLPGTWRSGEKKENIVALLVDSVF